MAELDRKVVEEIERRRLAPRPAVYFLARRSVFWTLAALSVALGAVSVAVIIYRVNDVFSTGGRGFDEMPFDDIAEVLPGVWVASFVLFIASAVLAVSRTRRGYRHRRLERHRRNHGRQRFSSASPSTRSAPVLPPMASWRRASRPTGSSPISPTPSGAGPTRDTSAAKCWPKSRARRVRIRDFDGREWEIDISAAEIALTDPLIEEGDIAIRGERTGPATFKAEFIDAFD